MTAKVETTTFEDLFHLTAEDAERALGKAKVAKLRAALEDFNSALAFKRPTHAKLGPGPYLTDGGTLAFEGDGYSLTILKSLSSLGDAEKAAVDGYIYGPMLRLKPELSGGNTSALSHLRFYPRDVLEKAFE
jgi:hypothetical protein